MYIEDSFTGLNNFQVKVFITNYLIKNYYFLFKLTRNRKEKLNPLRNKNHSIMTTH